MPGSRFVPDGARTWSDPGGRIEVARVQGTVEAELVRGLLEGYGITATLSDRLPRSILPVNVGRAGEVRILVEERDEAAAVEVIACHRQAGLVVLARDPGPDDAA